MCRQVHVSESALLFSIVSKVCFVGVFSALVNVKQIESRDWMHMKFSYYSLI